MKWTACKPKLELGIIAAIAFISAYLTLKILWLHSGRVFFSVEKALSMNLDLARIVYVALIPILWLCFLIFLQRWTTRPLEWLLGTVSIGIQLLILVAWLGDDPGIIGSKVLLGLPLLAGLIFLFVRGDRPEGIAELRSYLFPHRAIWAAALLVAAAVGLRYFEAYLHLAFFREGAVGDEQFFWWTSAERFLRIGLDGYLHQDFPGGSYFPNYPFFSAIFLGFLSASHASAALYSLPLLYGILVLWFWWQGLNFYSFRDKLLATAFFSALLLYHDWVFVLFHEVWFGEAMAVIAFYLIFCLLAKKSAPNTRDLFLAYGIGAFAVLSKPPLSYLLIPAVLPAYVFLGVLLQGAGRRSLCLRAGACGVGALVSQFLWKKYLLDSQFTLFYSGANFGSMLSWETWNLSSGAFPKLLAYIFPTYKMHWLAFALLAGLAIRRDFREFLPGILVTLGVVLSIFILYATLWSNQDHESAARYVLQPLLAWTFFAFQKTLASGKTKG